jgi:hypothetical protein
MAESSEVCKVAALKNEHENILANGENPRIIANCFQHVYFPLRG